MSEETATTAFNGEGWEGGRWTSDPDALPGSLATFGDATESRVEALRKEAIRLAHADARKGIPRLDATGLTESEVLLRSRCSVLLQRCRSQERQRWSQGVAESEERISRTLGKAALGVDRFERTANELSRLKARLELRRKEVDQDLREESGERRRGLPTPAYVGALIFLGLVEFFANAPVFNALLPRDPLSERQIQLLSELSTGWFAGMERMAAHILFRPDAALLAAGVITFLCVLAHFFGHALRDLVMQGERKERRHTVQGRSIRENIVPIILSGVGLALTLGVLYEARVALGQVGEERWVHDMEQVEEFRRQAGWLRVDGEILEANQLTNRAQDMEAAATELREYSLSMARMNFPILLLNLTLVLCAISAAYFHRRDARREHFNDTPFEDERKALVEEGEACAGDTSELLAEVAGEIRGLRARLLSGPGEGPGSLVPELATVFTTYRAENARLRDLNQEAIPPFAEPPPIPEEPEEAVPDGSGEWVLRTPEEYEEERKELVARFKELRARFNEQVALTW